MIIATRRSLRVFAENAWYDLKMRSFEDNAKFYFQWQRSAMLRALGNNGEWLKLSNIGANLKNIFLNVSYTVLGIY